MNELARRSRHLLPMYQSYLSAGPAVEITEDHALVDVAEMVTKGREGFALCQITGESMMSVIPPGAIVFIDTFAEPRNGSIVAASINGLVCVKEFRVKERKLYLVPTNHTYPTREVRETDSFHIIGVIKGCLSLF